MVNPNQENDKKSNNNTPFPIIIFTAFFWFLIGLFIMWIIIAIIWWLIAVLFIENLYIPYSIHITMTYLLFIFLLIMLSIIGFRIKAYISLKENRKILTIPYDYENSITDLHWFELTFSASERQYINLNEKILSKYRECPEKLLSYGVTLMNKKMYTEALSILRIILELPNVNPLITEIAKERILYLLPLVNNSGLMISNKLKEDPNELSEH